LTRATWGDASQWRLDDDWSYADQPIRHRHPLRFANHDGMHDHLGRLLEDDLDRTNAAGLVHAWEKHHVLSWLHDVGLDDLVSHFRAAKVDGEDLLKLKPKNVGDELKLTDQTAIMRVCAAIAPLQEAWKASRWAHGLKIKLGKPVPTRPKKLIAELHVLIYDLASLPPGASGAYVHLELGEHEAKSAFVPARDARYLGDPGSPWQLGPGAAGPGWAQSAGGGFLLQPCVEDDFLMRPVRDPAMGSWPQTFKLTIDEETMKQKDSVHGKEPAPDSIAIDVVGWFPQVGELSIGKVSVKLPPTKGPSKRLRIETPVRAELHWKSYMATDSVGDWVEEAPAIAPPPEVPMGWAWPDQGIVGWC